MRINLKVYRSMFIMVMVILWFHAQPAILKSQENKKMKYVFPGPEVSLDKGLLKKRMIYLAGPEILPATYQFHTAIPKGWQRQVEPIENKEYDPSKVLMVLADPVSGACTKVCVRELEQEICYTDWVEWFAQYNGINILEIRENEGLAGKVSEALGSISKTSSYPNSICRISAIRDGSRIFYVVTVVPEQQYSNLAKEIACVSLYFKLDKPEGYKLAEPFSEYRTIKPAPMRVLRPKNWELTSQEITSLFSIVTFDKKDENVMTARLILKVLSKKVLPEHDIKQETQNFLDYLETTGFLLPSKVTSIGVKSKAFQRGELLTTSLNYGKNSFELRLVVWESADVFYSLCVLSVPRTYSPWSWMNARGAWAVTSQSLNDWAINNREEL